jgi:hypothetical protein
MTKLILFITGIFIMYISITGKLIQYINIKEPIAEIYIFIIGFIMSILSLMYNSNKLSKNR